MGDRVVGSGIAALTATFEPLGHAYDHAMLIRRATADDALSARVTAVRAFVDDPVMRWLHPDDDVFLAPGGEVLRGAFDGWLGIDEVWCTDDCAGVAVWIPPGRPEISLLPRPRPVGRQTDLSETRPRRSTR